MEEINYKNGYVFFIDILGFKKLIETRKASGIKKLIDYFHDFFLNGNFAEKIKEHYSITQVSDCIALIILKLFHDLLNNKLFFYYCLRILS